MPQKIRLLHPQEVKRSEEFRKVIGRLRVVKS